MALVMIEGFLVHILVWCTCLSCTLILYYNKKPIILIKSLISNNNIFTLNYLIKEAEAIKNTIKIKKINENKSLNLKVKELFIIFI